MFEFDQLKVIKSKKFDSIWFEILIKLYRTVFEFEQSHLKIHNKRNQKNVCTFCTAKSDKNKSKNLKFERPSLKEI